MSVSIPRRARAAAIVGAAAVASLSGFASAQQQFSLQHANSIDLSGAFFGEGPMGEPPSDFGTNPLSVAYDGSSVYVGGWNGSGSASNVGIVRVNSPLSLGSSLTSLNPTVFSANASRGLDYLASSGAGAVLGLYDDGTGNGFIRRYDASGNQQWSVTPGNIVAGYRPSAMAIDPLADNGQPALGMVGIGSGRRAALRLSDGSLVYGPSGAPTPPPLGEIINPNPASVGGVTLGFTYRGIAFDSQGNVAVTAAGGTSYGVRDTQGGTNFNRFVNLDGTSSATSPIAVKQTASGPALNVGQQLGFLEGLGAETMLAVSERIGAPFELTLTSSRPGVPQLTGLDSRHVQLITTTGARPAGLLNPALTGEEDGLGSAYTEDVKGIAVGRDANNLPALFVVSFTQRRLDVYNLEPTWNSSTGGTWSDTSRWVFGVVPSGPLDNARFGDVISGPATVTVDGPKTVKVIKFDSANSYTLSGPGSITLNSPGQPVITAIQGSHTIGVPVTLVKDTFVTALHGQTISVKRFTGAGLEIASGTVRILPDGTSAGTSNVASLTIAGDVEPTAKLDVTNNAFVVDYTGDTPFDTIRAQVVSGYAGGAWTGEGITSSSANANQFGIGYGEASALASVPAIFGTVDATAVLLRYTRYGDANLDGQVNLADFNRLASNFGATGTGVWTQGDFNYDGNVNLQDFNRLAANFGLSAAGPQVTPDDWARLGAAVPEPTGAALSGMALLSLARRVRRRG